MPRTAKSVGCLESRLDWYTSHIQPPVILHPGVQETTRFEWGIQHGNLYPTNNGRGWHCIQLPSGVIWNNDPLHLAIFMATSFPNGSVAVVDLLFRNDQVWAPHLLSTELPITNFLDCWRWGSLGFAMWKIIFWFGCIIGIQSHPEVGETDDPPIFVVSGLMKGLSPMGSPIGSWVR